MKERSLAKKEDKFEYESEKMCLIAIAAAKITLFVFATSKNNETKWSHFLYSDKSIYHQIVSLWYFTFLFMQHNIYPTAILQITYVI